MKLSVQRLLCLAVSTGLLFSCANQKPHKPAPVVVAKTGSSSAQRAAHARKALPGEIYVVKKGDTLSAIAGSRQMTVAQIAALNSLNAPYRIFIGQRLRLSDQDSSPGEVKVTPYQDSGVTTAPVSLEGGISDSNSSRSSVSSAPPVAVATTTVNAGSTRTEQTPVESVKKDNTKSVTNWQWPVKGMVLKKFGQGSKGIDISGQAGQAVMAAADGVVVYSGDKLRGYGNMIIIKHNDEFLSAYTHNSQLRAKENDKVKAGTHIADMGVNEQGAPALHFEIRYKGKPVDPLQYLQ